MPLLMESQKEYFFSNQDHNQLSKMRESSFLPHRHLLVEAFSNPLHIGMGDRHHLAVAHHNERVVEDPVLPNLVQVDDE